MQKQLIQTLKILLAAIVLSFGISYVYAWTGPASAPPTGNTNPPLVSTTDTAAIQTTEGKLVANAGLATMGNVIVDNDVNALNYCDENGSNCVAGSALGGAAGKWNDVNGGIHYSGGNVGIGTGAVAPGAQLEVAGTGEIVLTENSPQIKFNDTDPGAYKYWIHNNGDRLYFLNDGGLGGSWTGGRPLTIYKDKVGIGTANPTTSLDVVGDIKTSGSVRASGVVYLSQPPSTSSSSFTLSANGARIVPRGVYNIGVSSIRGGLYMEVKTVNIIIGNRSWPTWRRLGTIDQTYGQQVVSDGSNVRVRNPNSFGVGVTMIKLFSI